MKLAAIWLLSLTAAGQTSLVDAIQADSLRGRISFLASDLLEGRDTPSRGLDIAAEYIASEFRRAGLDGPPGFFQFADFIAIRNRAEGLQLVLSGAGETRSVGAEGLEVRAVRGLHLENQPVFKWAPGVKMPPSVAGHVLVLRRPSDSSTLAALELARPDAIVELSRRLDPEPERDVRLEPGKDPDSRATPVVMAREGELESVFDRLPNGAGSGRVTLHVPDPLITPARVKNVIGILRGSDSRLRNQALVISAHYDHLGLTQGADPIYNGANDNASGVAGVIELAHAFAQRAHPKRTLIFVAFFGEEKGLLGSAYYVAHPLVALSDTIADINFEQIGRPNRDDGLPPGQMGVTGYELSNLASSIASDAGSAGVKIDDTKHNEEYFARSDNYSFAKAGIPAQTFVAAYEYPDYHQVTDSWEKLDYGNMATLLRAIALGILDLADREAVPHWNETNPAAKSYWTAWRALHK